MDIKGLDYNTQRSKLVLSEYGREIQKMVEYACDLPTKEERLKCAMTIIRQMENKNPQLRENADYEQTLWNHQRPTRFSPNLSPCPCPTVISDCATTAIW